MTLSVVVATSSVGRSARKCVAAAVSGRNALRASREAGEGGGGRWQSGWTVVAGRAGGGVRPRG